MPISCLYSNINLYSNDCNNFITASLNNQPKALHLWSAFKHAIIAISLYYSFRGRRREKERERERERARARVRARERKRERERERGKGERERGERGRWGEGERERGRNGKKNGKMENGTRNLFFYMFKS